MTIDEIRQYIQRELLLDETAVIEPDQDLLLSETLDSLSVTRLVQHLESQLGVTIPPEDVTLENFSSLQAIHAYLGTTEA
jgi:acyl carrier protein